MNRSKETWVKNMCQKLEGICTDIDQLVCKEPVIFVGNQMETVGANVKNFFSGFVGNQMETVHATQLVPSKSTNLVKSSTNSVVEIKENTVDSNSDNPTEAPLADKESCHKQTSTGLHHSEQITSKISQHLVGERDSLMNGTSDNTAQVNLSSSTSGQSLDNRFEERVCYDESLHSDATAFELSDWGIENIIDLNLDIDNMVEGEPLMNLEEKKTLLNSPVDELECDLNTSTTHQASEPESSVTCNENQEENSNHIIAGGSTTHQSSEEESSVTCNENQEENSKDSIAGGLSSENVYESLNSSFKNSTVEPDTIYFNPTETVDYFSVSSDILSSCGSFTTIACDSNIEADVSCSGTGLADVSMVDFEDVNYDAVESGVSFQGGKHSLFPKTSRSKSYKKMIQDAFMSRKRLTKEYKQLAIWYGDIDKELCQPTESGKQTESSKPPAQDLQDSEWELL